MKAPKVPNFVPALPKLSAKYALPPFPTTARALAPYQGYQGVLQGRLGALTNPQSRGKRAV